MPRHKPYTLPLTPEEQRVVDRMHEITREAMERAERGDYTLVDMMREDVRDIMRRKHDALSHPHSEATKARIAVASRARAKSARRDHRGRFSSA